VIDPLATNDLILAAFMGGMAVAVLLLQIASQLDEWRNAK
jgi:hypothetical protein